MAIIVDKLACAKSGDCVATCPSVFEFDAQGFAQVKSGSDTSQPCVETAIGSCPTGAIYWA